LFMEELDDSSEASGTRITIYKGGETQLRADFPRYREDQSTPLYFYPTGGTNKTIGLFPVPDAAKTYRYYYEADVNVTVATDSLPFVTTTEAQVFVRMAARHFKYLKASAAAREGLFPRGIDSDPVILHARSTLMSLLRQLPDNKTYGKRYG